MIGRFKCPQCGHLPNLRRLGRAPGNQNLMNSLWLIQCNCNWYERSKIDTNNFKVVDISGLKCYCCSFKGPLQEYYIDNIKLLS